MPRALDVNLDAGEMILKMDKRGDEETVEYSKLDRLVLASEQQRKLFRTGEVKKIEVHVRGMPEPYVIDSSNVGDYEHVEGYLLQVARKYDVAVEHANQ